MFFVLFSNIFLRVFRGHFNCTFWWIWEHIIETVFYKLQFWFLGLSSKVSQTMCKWRLKLQFFFLNLSSKVLAGVGVRTSKYPYMDICGIWRPSLWKSMHVTGVQRGLQLKRNSLTIGYVCKQMSIFQCPLFIHTYHWDKTLQEHVNFMRPEIHPCDLSAR